jgi:hypothetical protein
MLPRMTDTVLLDGCVPLLQRYPDLSADQANALLRSARAFQQGLWVAEDDPALSWIKLISAVETAAAHRGRSGRARKKFIDFLVDFLPNPPSPRPAVGGFNWSSTTALRRAFRIIHDWGSKELHEGIPFPAAMCDAPMPYD